MATRGLTARIYPAKIVAGGETGVDRAALDTAMSRHISVGGWCPHGRLAEDGIIPECYPLKETPASDFAIRTKLNVRDSDGTLIISALPLIGGTKLTAEWAKKLKKPLFIINTKTTLPAHIKDARKWINKNKLKVLDIAGPRASQEKNIYKTASKIIDRILQK